MARTAARRKTQQGISLVGLIFVLAILGFLGVLGLKIVPTYVEYRAISNGIKLAKASGSTVREIQAAFDKNASVTYIDTLKGKDLLISAESGEIEVSFAYEKRIPLVGPASLLIDYSGSTARGGAPAKPAE